MNYLLFILKFAILDFPRNKVRTFLTALGILIGVASVVLLLAFGTGLRIFIKQQFENLGSNLVYVLPGTLGSRGMIGPRPGAFGSIRFDEKDLTTLKKIPEVEAVVGVFMKSVSVASRGETELTDVFATTYEIFPVRNFEADYGKVFDKADLSKHSKVVVLGPTITTKLFGPPDSAIGKTVKIEGQGYRVIGVLKAKGSGGLGGPDFDSFLYVPYTAALQINPNKDFIVFYLKAKDETSIKSVREKAKALLSKRYENDVFSVIEQTEILSAVTSIFSALSTVLVAIGAVSLIVAGVGIMNIMYVTVTERIKEIGVRRAVGATKRDILVQFLAEAAILSLLGGILGLLVAFIIVLVVQRFFPAYIDVTSVVVSLLVSSAVGIIFGVLPALNAANLQPIDALRYE